MKVIAVVGTVVLMLAACSSTPSESSPAEPTAAESSITPSYRTMTPDASAWDHSDAGQPMPTPTEQTLVEWVSDNKAAIVQHYRYRQAADAAVEAGSVPRLMKSLRGAGNALVAIPDSPRNGYLSDPWQEAGYEYLAAAQDVGNRRFDAASRHIAAASKLTKEAMHRLKASK